MKPSSAVDEVPYAVIIGTARDCGPHLEACLAALRGVASRFSPRSADVGYVFFENDSRDDSAEMLKAFCANDPARRELIIERDLDQELPKRTHRLAHARNALLARVAAKGWLSHLEILIVADLDDVNATVSGVEEALRLVTCPGHLDGALDVAVANQRGRYYDRWALRTAAITGNEWAICNRCSPATSASLRFFFPDGGTDLQSIHPGAGPVAALSAFGGIALYRGAKLRARADAQRFAGAYDGCDEAMAPGCCLPIHEGQDCEHVAFHAALDHASRETGEGNLRVAIVPSLLNAGPATAIESGAGAEFLTVAPDGSSYSAGIRGVVQYTRELDR